MTTNSLLTKLKSKERITQQHTSLQDVSTEDLVLLIKGCLRQDRNSQHLLYLKYYGFALKIVYRYMGDYPAAIRLTNEVMIKVFRSFSDFKGLEHIALKHSFGRWIKDIFIQAVVGWSQSKERSEIPATSSDQTETDIWDMATADDVADARLYRTLISQVLSLPLSHRLIFNLYVIDGYTADEVAGISGMRVERAERYLSEARTMLRDSTAGN